MKRWLTVVLVASLAANVFLAGFVGGRIFAGPHGPHGPPGRHGPPPGARGGDPARVIGEAVALSPTARAAVREAVAARRGEFRKSRRAAFAARERLRATLVAEPFDRAATEAALADMRAEALVREETMTELLLDVFEALPAEERAALAEAAAEERDRRRRRRGRFGPRRNDGDPPAER